MDQDSKIAFYMLTWPAKQYILMLSNSESVEDCAAIFDSDPEAWMNLLYLAFQYRENALLSKYFYHWSPACRR